MRGLAPVSLRLVALAVALALGVSGCGHKYPARFPSSAPAVEGDAAHPVRATGWVETKLYFGLGPADHSEQGISEAKWREFLDREVTPRFPDGLSVVDAYGQWRGKGQRQPERERSKVLILAYPDGPENRTKIEAIRAAWKKMTGDESVLRVTTHGDVSF